jgi:hypothetical protein
MDAGGLECVNLSYYSGDKPESSHVAPLLGDRTTHLCIDVMYFGPFFADETLQLAAEQCPQLRSFASHLLDIGASLELVLRRCRLLTRLCIEHTYSLTDASVASLMPLCPQITSLTLRGCGALTDASIAEVARWCPQLTSVDLSVTKITSVAAVAHACPALTSLNVSLCTSLTDDSILAVSDACPLLAHLFVEGCTNVTDASIDAVVSKCRLLVTLTVHHCPQVNAQRFFSVWERELASRRK